MTIEKQSWKDEHMTGAQVRAARALLGWSAKRLADATGIGIATIFRLEKEDGELKAMVTTQSTLIRCLTEAGVILLDENGEGPGVRLRKLRKQRPAT